MSLYEDSINLLRQMVRIPSLSGQEAAVAACVREALAGFGITCE